MRSPRRRFGRGCDRATPRPTSTSRTRTRHPVLAAAVRRRRHLRQELQEQDPRHRGHRPAVERQRARLRRHDPDRQHDLDGGQAEELVARSVPGGRDASWARRRRVTSIALGVGNDSTAGGDDAVVRRRRRRRCPRSSTRSQAFDTLFAQLRPDQRSGGGRRRAMRKRALGQSVIDFVIGDVNRLHARLAPAEQQKLRSAPGRAPRSREAVRRADDGRHAARPARVPAQAERDERSPTLKRYNGGEPYFDAITERASSTCWRRRSPATSPASRRCS